jgi:hypothetical protein
MLNDTPEETLLGFDARRGGLDAVDERWDTDRRSLFLLRPDIGRPISVGVFAWPSVFDYEQGLLMSQEARSRVGLDGLRTPDWVGANSGLWDNLDRMRTCLDAAGADSTSYTLIAATWLSLLGFMDGGDVGPYAEPTEPDRLSPRWTRLGLDVADGSCVSSLTECSYPAEDHDALRAKWVGRLNSYHLFNDSSDAFEFAEYSNIRIPEHAPFFVFSIYHIPIG